MTTKYSVAELKKICKKNGITGYSKMKKSELMKHCIPKTPKTETPKLKKIKNKKLDECMKENKRLRQLLKKSPVKESPVKKSPVKKSPVKKSPVKKSPNKKELKLTTQNKRMIKEKIIELLNEFTTYKKRVGEFSISISDHSDQPGGTIDAIFSYRQTMINKIKSYLNKIGLSAHDIDIQSIYDSIDRLEESTFVAQYMWEKPDLSKTRSKYTKEYVMKNYEINQKPFRITIENIKFLKAKETRWTSINDTIEIKTRIHYN